MAVIAFAPGLYAWPTRPGAGALFIPRFRHDRTDTVASRGRAGMATGPDQLCSALILTYSGLWFSPSRAAVPLGVSAPCSTDSDHPAGEHECAGHDPDCCGIHGGLLGFGETTRV